MPDEAIHWYRHDEMLSILDGDFIIQCTDDNGDGRSDIPILDECRADAESYCKGVIDSGGKNDSSEWDVDANNDGISDNVPGDVKLICKEINAHFIARRRRDEPQDIKDMYNLADLKLQRLAQTSITTPTTQPISGNMTKEDLGYMTEGGTTGDPLPWSELL